MDQGLETEVKIDGETAGVDKPNKRTYKKPKPMPRLCASAEKRLKALKKLEYEAVKQKVNYYVELHALETKYQQLLSPVHQQRCDIISGNVEPSPSDCEWTSDESDADTGKSPKKQTEAHSEDRPIDQKGIPEFWMNILDKGPFLPERIQEHDRPALKALNNIKVEYLPNGWCLEFLFARNEYFANSVLSKEYEIDFMPSTIPGRRLNYYGPTGVACSGCAIDWKPGKDVTKIPLSDKPGFKDSFFNFFRGNTTVNDIPDDERPCSTLELEFEFLRIMRENVLPRAASFYAKHYSMEHADDEEADSYAEEEDEDYCVHTCSCDVAASSHIDDNDDD